MSLMVRTAFASKMSHSHIEHPLSRSSNSAGAPLPLIPRRSSSTPRSSVKASFDTPVGTTLLVVQPPTPPDIPGRPMPDDSDSSSTSSDGSRPTVKPRSKVQGVRGTKLRLPEQSTPTPSFFLKGSAKRSPSGNEGPASDHDTPRPPLSERNKGLRPQIHTEKLHLRHSSESQLSSVIPEPASSPILIPPSVEARLLRKKSGEPLKSSLKSMKRPPRGSITVVTGSGVSTKSEPNTPTHSKFVHFDAKLEHVKLFLAEQKPLAVSRDGSPTSDTSGTDSDFPSFIFGAFNLVLEVTNMPSNPKEEADVALKSLAMFEDQASIHGRVRVRNIAFEKWVAVRFTFDSWQTTSEVTAKYLESDKSGSFDIFSFVIKLNDILPRIEEKTLFLALRYSVNGREIWDNNGGQNYLAKFSKVKVRSQNKDKRLDETGSDISDLQAKLEQVIRGRENINPSTPSPRRPSPVTSREKLPLLKTNSPLSSRYDFSASSRTPWKGDRPLSSRHSRMNTFPNTAPFPPKSFTPVKAKRQITPLGSPRDLDDVPQPPRHMAPLDDLPFQMTPRQRRGRNHQRGYFDLSMPDASGVRKTPPTTPPSDSPPTRPREISRVHPPPFETVFSPTWSNEQGTSSGGSQESTPSMTSGSPSTDSSSDENQYSAFLDRFCFYRGPESFLGVSTDFIPRSYSASSVEEFLSQSPPSAAFFSRDDHSSQFSTPTRSPSFDDVVYRSGSSTPTVRSLASPPKSPSPAR